ncbi:hypothetical protein [Periweissella fabalis]|uniref:Uncharacterized protein n=1 Tax=Periweissella fabalis TaxID=1070421 RepID=A0A7X6S3K2_9LACO|nr:hypothetical protein [Periweissella fabalis]MCM0599868.1 hypothetical protein [Periweissella fabalis]NKZ24077.1 hypothetical protein [Periweissella fabalis]
MLFVGLQIVIKEENKLFLVHIIISILTLVSVMLANWQLFATVAIIAIIAYQLVALHRGITMFFYWPHQISRLIISITLIVLIVLA